MFKEHEIWNIFKVLAAILHIGNVKFKGPNIFFFFFFFFVLSNFDEIFSANVIDNLESVNVCDAENIVRIAGLLQVIHFSILFQCSSIGKLEHIDREEFHECFKNRKIEKKEKKRKKMNLNKNGLASRTRCNRLLND